MKNFLFPTKEIWPSKLQIYEEEKSLFKIHYWLLRYNFFIKLNRTIFHSITELQSTSELELRKQALKAYKSKLHESEIN